MSKHRKRRKDRRPPPGSVPGALVIHGDSPKPVIRVMDFCPAQVMEKTLASASEVVSYLTDATSSVTWVDVQGLGERQVLEELGEIFRLHRLALADVVNTMQRPKVEIYDNHIFVITRMVLLGPSGESSAEQVSLFLGRNFVLTFQETYGDCLDPVRQRIRQSTGAVRTSGADYLAYTILDAITDQYFPVIEALGERIEALEDEVIAHPAPAALRRIYDLKRELLGVRRGIWPQRDALTSLIRDESGLIGREVKVYLRDCYDHTVQLIEVNETLRELTSGLLDVYLSAMANRTNEVMKILTVVTTIFIPLTFIAGVYGMNFKNMPELNWPYGYFMIWGVMALVGIALLGYFIRRGWLQRVDLLPPRYSQGRSGEPHAENQSQDTPQSLQR